MHRVSTVFPASHEAHVLCSHEGLLHSKPCTRWLPRPPPARRKVPRRHFEHACGLSCTQRVLDGAGHAASVTDASRVTGTQKQQRTGLAFAAPGLARGPRQPCGTGYCTGPRTRGLAGAPPTAPLPVRPRLHSSAAVGSPWPSLPGERSRQDVDLHPHPRCPSPGLTARGCGCEPAWM